MQNVYEFIAIGAGPANLSLGAQAVERGYQPGKDFIILEKDAEISWHPGMLLPGSRLDTHFAKDLVTLVNPMSRFTFLNFLVKHKRLEDFLNCGHSTPYRRDFDEYLRWVANAIGNGIQTDTCVSEIERDESGLYLVRYLTSDGSYKEVLARDIVLGVGGRPKYPLGLSGDDARIIHSADFLTKIAKLEDFTEDNSILVVGAGQSAAELVKYLINTTKNNIDVAISDFGFGIKEGTAFMNESYNGEFIDRFFDMPSETRKWFVNQRKNMNYGVVDETIINGLYNDYYYDKHFERRSVSFLQFCRAAKIETRKNQPINVHFFNHELGRNFENQYDYVVLATGYEFSEPSRLLRNVYTNLTFEGDSLRIERDYSIHDEHGFSSGRVYMNGNVSKSHGPAQDVLSVIAHRSRDILHSIMSDVKVEPRETVKTFG
ncbi:lysine N(6)-hydroxylase/L-ornithine N(5)-oxygenase family protein [Halomonas desiderata]|uniref:SidA/IucD/PvdA family monooxygenase n=1 Tax=Billgrantia desiderata TaxID=52021 RepID=A0ABS9B5K3_9GAMM|nr:SidA/IucD/PvdA family monooxygenase [Halomonas desiderata]MCE8042609.1 SidA/IucD/PvdA family monooxygenase [Halomonas desiderata]MCE8047184.1 SidA/IucD/PvdA family monooxygenase [Halomonas desiderata]NIC37835.1 lysine N(6)-hydroxylase/L-ornithine N(5)-oxygenase family protein [Halomonas desiderata]